MMRSPRACALWLLVMALLTAGWLPTEAGAATEHRWPQRPRWPRTPAGRGGQSYGPGRDRPGGPVLGSNPSSCVNSECALWVATAATEVAAARRVRRAVLRRNRDAPRLPAAPPRSLRLPGAARP